MPTKAPDTVISRPATKQESAPEFKEIDQRGQQEFGHTHFTVLRWLEGSSALKRVYSTDPELYPVGGEKRMPLDSPWIQTVIRSQKSHLCLTPDDITSTYNDYKPLLDQGLGQIFCIPIVSEKGESLGAFSISHKPGQYTKDTVNVMEKLNKELGVDSMERYIARAEK